MTLALYWKTGTFDFINYDDQEYVYSNSNVITGLTLKNIRWAITASDMGNWNPLTWLSHMLDCELFGLNPKGHHLTNTLLHTINVILLCYGLNQATKCFWPSAFVAALFSLHPLHVESVAWIAERKDLLSGMFFMLTLIAYTRYTQQIGNNRYLLVVTAYVCGLSAKPMLVTLPFILLLLDYWPLQRFPWNTLETKPSSSSLPVIVKEKIALIFLSICISFVTFSIQKNHGALLHFDRYPLSARFANAITSYSTYIIKTLWPNQLAILYPIDTSIQSWKVVLSLLSLFYITAFALFKVKKHPYLIVGWLWYVTMLTPVIGILQAGLQSRADRYTYLPLIGFFIMCGWGTQTLLNNWHWNYKKHLTVFISLTILLCLALATSRQLDYWRNGVTLYTHTLNVTRNNFTVHYNLAATLANRGQIDDAIIHYREAIRVAPFLFEEAHVGLAFELAGQGKYKEALPHYAEVLRANPNNTPAKEGMKHTMNKLLGMP